ncbi:MULTISPECIES: hypothetical protein [Pantoea]|uniref:hypothetical protein n=1 Tax=Pantoea TaxID=53335 RepID=UPI0028A02138|nr:hypothetical protein [Pantoea endophytica]
MLINDLNGGHPYMQHQVAGKVLRLLPVWFTVLLLVQLLLFNASAEDRCHFNEAVCSVKAIEDNYWLRATCDNDAALIVSLEAPSGELQDVRNGAYESSGGWIRSGDALSGHINILYAHTPTLMLELFYDRHGVLSLQGLRVDGELIKFPTTRVRQWARWHAGKCK